MENLIKISTDNVKKTHGITRNGNAIVTIQYVNDILKCTTEQKCIIRRGNYNSLLYSNLPITGAIVTVKGYDLPIFKTLKF